VFKHELGNPNSLSGVFISSLFKDRFGSLCIGCDEFWDKFDPVNETVTHHRIDTDDAQGETVPVTHITQAHAGMLWLSTLRGLFRFDPSLKAQVRMEAFNKAFSEVRTLGNDGWITSKLC
jgi:ligand-binding sensor domain-containing protein